MKMTPNAGARHWSAAFTGKPWAAGATGPDAFDCWGLVRHVQRERYGRDLAHLAVPSDGQQWRTVREVVQWSGWARVVDAPREGDALLMLDPFGDPHIGVVVAVPGLWLLHALEGRGVQLDRLDMLGLLGLGHLQCWRHA